MRELKYFKCPFLLLTFPMDITLQAIIYFAWEMTSLLTKEYPPHL